MSNEVILLQISDIIGIASFALSGFYVSTKDRLDLLGIFIASFLTALGGGVIRDVISGKFPSAFLDYIPVLIVIIVLFLAIFLKLHIKNELQNSKYLILSDSIGLISFSISGALVGVHLGFSFFGVALLAVITATGGGVMRDILLNRVPMLLTSELYGTISMIIGFFIYMLDSLGYINFFTLLALFVVGLVFRLTAYYKRWHLPYLKHH